MIVVVFHPAEAVGFSVDNLSSVSSVSGVNISLVFHPDWVVRRMNDNVRSVECLY